MRYARLLISLPFLTACATLVNGINEDVHIASTPAGAKVYVDGDLKGETPITVPMGRKDFHDVRIEKDGYEEFQETIGRAYSPWILGNLCPLGPVSLAIGGGVDYVSGGAFKLGPTQIDADLTPRSK